MNSRIKELRKALKLNQAEFGDRIGLKQSAVANYESGTRSPLDAVISSICKEYKVNESWLRTGEGEMFVSRPEEDILMDFVNDVSIGGNEFKKRFISAIAQMDDKTWDHFEKWLNEFLAKYLPEKQNDQKESDN